MKLICKKLLLKTLNYVLESIYIASSIGRGRGVFTKKDIKKNTIIEVAPVIVLSKKDRSFLDQTLLHDYIFEWGEESGQCCMALGYVPLYNHAYESNCEYEMFFTKEIITVTTVRSIQAGEELFINYNGDWNNKKRLWFEAQ